MTKAPKKVNPIERPTLAERFVGIFHLPYGIGCLLIGFVILGLPLEYLDAALVSGPLAGHYVTHIIKLFANPLFVSFFTVTGLLRSSFFFVPGYMRRRLLKAERTLSPLIPEGETGFHKLFGRVSAVRPQIILWLVFWGLVALLFEIIPGDLSALPSSEAWGIALTQFMNALIALGIGSIVWTYVRASWGIHKLGMIPLKLTPYLQDPFLGLRAVGTLSLGLAASYSFFLGLYFADFSILVIARENLLSDGLLLPTLIIPGILLFFLPMTSLHRVMVREKRLEEGKVGEEVFQTLSGDASNPSSSQQVKMLRLDMMKKASQSIATWPFDYKILSQFTIIIVSVIATLLASAILRILHL